MQLSPEYLTVAVLALLTLAACVPLGVVMWVRRGARGWRDGALQLHRAQLDELDRDLAFGRLDQAEHRQARLEVQRRMLAAAAEADTPTLQGGRAVLIVALVLVPVGSAALYLINGQPELPSVPFAERAQIEASETDRLVGELRARLASLDAHSEPAREGFMLLGNIEASRGNFAQAAQAWAAALAVKFDATTAAEEAEALTRANGRVTAEAVALFRRALAEGPQNADWHDIAVERLKQAGAAP